MLFSAITSTRLWYRKLTRTDYQILLPFFQNSEATKFYYPQQPPELYCMAWIERQLSRYDKDGYGLCAMIEKSSGEFVGQCGLLNQLIDNQKELEIGYLVMPKYWSQGFATEAAITFRNYAFLNNMSDSIISIIDINNIKSQKVAERNQMKKEIQTNFNGHDVFIFRIKKSDWQG